MEDRGVSERQVERTVREPRRRTANEGGAEHTYLVTSVG